MSEPERDPTKVPLLFPDPVIEFYLAKVDRAAIREQLKRTPAERLQWCEEKARREQAAHGPVVREEPDLPPVKKQKIDMGADPAWFAAAAAVPLLFPDPVVEAYLEDVDRGLLRENLKLTIAERLERFADFMSSVYELRGSLHCNQTELWLEHSVNNAGATSEN